jgi:hypothetical protein
VGVGASPLAFAIAVGARAAARRVSHARRARASSPAAELRDRVAAARAASEGSDARVLDAAAVRALQAAAVAHAGVSVRGAVGDEVTARLEGAGVTWDAARIVAELLRECEAARFAPDAATMEAARDRWERARQAMRALEGK